MRRSIANERPSRARKIRPTPTPTDISTNWSTIRVRESGRVGDSVPDERQGNGRLEQAEVSGPQREDRRDVHQQQHEPCRRQRRVDVEGAHRHIDGEQLQDPARGLQEDRPCSRKRRAEHREALAGHHEKSPQRPRAFETGPPASPLRTRDGEGEEQDTDHQHDDQARHRPVRDLRGREDVQPRAGAPERGRRAGARRPCRRECRSSQGRAGGGAAGRRRARAPRSGPAAPRSRAARSRRPRRPGRNAGAAGRAPGRSSAARRASAPSTDARFRPIANTIHAQSTMIERARDEAPVGAAPPEEGDDCGEGGEHERGPEPGTARDVPHAATCLSTPRAES